MRYEDAVDRLVASWPSALPGGPPALIPVLTDAGAERPIPPDLDGRTRAASVLVLVLPGEDGDARILLTERVDRGGHHAGEVSFPGGSAEPGDPDEVATALREAAEEVGLDALASEVRVVGLLEAFTIPVSSFRVTPVVAIAGRRQAWSAQPTEVARVLEAPLAGFLPGAPIVMVERTIRDWPLRYGAYPVDDLLIWGATARVLGQLGALLAG